MNIEKNKLNVFSLTMIVISLVIGMGIFRTASDAALAAGTPSIFFCAWIFGGVIALFGALSYAEIGSRYPIIGGYYKIFSYAFHPSLAFALNCVILISNAASLAGVALIGTEYIAPVLSDHAISDLGKSWIAMSAILTFYGVNLLGLRMSSNTQNVLMIIKIGMILILILSLLFINHSAEQITEQAVSLSSTSMLGAFGASLVSVCFTYGGYQQSINFGGEVNDAKKVLPRGIIVGIFIVIILYLTVNYAYYKIIGFEELKHAKGIASIIAEKIFGPIGKTVFSVLLFTAVLAYVNVLLLSNPRVMFAMADDGILPKIFQKRTQEKDVLIVSLTVFTLITIIILFFANTFDKILGFTMFLDSIGMATSAATLFVIRKKTAHLDGTGIYKMKLFPIATLIFIGAYLFVSFTIIRNTPWLAGIGALVFVTFLGLYFVIKKWNIK
ncbi:MAG: APC family permease [Saprospiraceae bacterium]|nr:APC family permease [Candidatus Defluviibacterium haderslevense]